MAEKFKSVTAYITLAFVIGVFIVLITSYASEIASSPHSALSNSSKNYVAEITGNEGFGVNATLYEEDIGSATDLGGNDNKNEFSLDFSFGDKSANKLVRFVYIALNVPEFIIMDLLRLSSLKWFADLLDWAVRIFLFMAIALWIRRGDN